MTLNTEESATVGNMTCLKCQDSGSVIVSNK